MVNAASVPTNLDEGCQLQQQPNWRTNWNSGRCADTTDLRNFWAAVGRVREEQALDGRQLRTCMRYVPLKMRCDCQSQMNGQIMQECTAQPPVALFVA